MTKSSIFARLRSIITAVAKPLALDSSLKIRIGAVRSFNRFYTKQIGVLHEGFLRGPFSLTEGRVLQEFAQHENLLANTIARDLDLDEGYLSRILRNFARKGLIERTRSASDGRRRFLALTANGRKAFSFLDRSAKQGVGKMLGGLPAADQSRLTNAVHTVEDLLGTPKDKEPGGVAYSLRMHRSGDMGWVVHRHGVLYKEE